MAMSAQRRAENEARLRQANESLGQKAEELSVDQVPLLCECPHEDCREVVLVPLGEFRALTVADVPSFLYAPGHVTQYDVPVEDRGAYVVVHKQGEEAALLEDAGF